MEMVNVKLLNQTDIDICSVGYVYKNKEYSFPFFLDGNSYLEKYINTKDDFYKKEIFKILYSKLKNKVYLNDKKFDIQINRIINEIKTTTTYKTYIIKDYNTGFYKIGKSRNPKIREKTLQSENPNIAIVKVFNEDIEKILHDSYKENRLRGEWFNLNNIQIKYICTKYEKTNTQIISN